MNRFRSRKRWAPALLLWAGLATACHDTRTREEFYAGGAMRSLHTFLLGADSVPIRHGIQMSWYPDGGKESMEIYVHGYQEGYAFRWHPNGRMKALERYGGGMKEGEARFWDESGRLVACRTRDDDDCLRASHSEAPSERSSARL